MASSSLYPFQNVPISQMINHRLRASNILLHFISSSNNSNLDVIEFGIHYLYKEDAFSISHNSLFTDQSLPYFIIFNLHNSISFYPKILDQVCLCVYTKLNNLSSFVVDRLYVSLFQRFDIVFYQLKNVSISSSWKQALSALRALFICIFDCDQALFAISVLVMTSYNWFSIICVVILHANATYKQTSINFKTIAFALSSYFLIINFSRLMALISLLQCSLLHHQLLMQSWFSQACSSHMNQYNKKCIKNVQILMLIYYQDCLSQELRKDQSPFEKLCSTRGEKMNSGPKLWILWMNGPYTIFILESESTIVFALFQQVVLIKESTFLVIVEVTIKGRAVKTSILSEYSQANVCDKKSSNRFVALQFSEPLQDVVDAAELRFIIPLLDYRFCIFSMNILLRMVIGKQFIFIYLRRSSKETEAKLSKLYFSYMEDNIQHYQPKCQHPFALTMRKLISIDLLSLFFQNLSI